MRIVALVPGGISEQLLFLPTLDDLKQTYPEAQIDVVVEPGSQAAYRVSKSVNESLLFSYKDRKSLADWSNLLGILRDREYEVAIFTGQALSVTFVLWLAGIPTRVGYAGGAGQRFLTRAIGHNKNQYRAHTYHDLLTGLGVSSPCPEFSVSIPTSDLDWADAERKRLGIQTSGYVLIYGTAVGETSANNPQDYPISSWKGILQDFQHRQPDLPLVLLQGAENGEWVGALMQAFPSLKVTAPEDVGKLIAMIAGASLMLSTDADPLQMAVAAKTYALGLFGSTIPEQRLPASDRFIAVKSLTGQLADISPQMVSEKIWGG